MTNNEKYQQAKAGDWLDRVAPEAPSPVNRVLGIAASVLDIDSAEYVALFGESAELAGRILDAIESGARPADILFGARIRTTNQ